MTALSELLVAANTTGLSARAVARLARERGHTLNHDTAARYLRGDHGIPDEATLLAFSDILGVPMRKLRAAAELPSEMTAPYIPPSEASRLTRRQRRALDEIIRAMLEPTTRSEAGGASVDDVGDDADEADDDDVQRAARHGQPEDPPAT